MLLLCINFVHVEVITKKRSDHEIFITKIYIHVIFSNFMKNLNHENLKLYGTLHYSQTFSCIDISLPKPDFSEYICHRILNSTITHLVATNFRFYFEV